ncbi:MAG: hypothetical protein BGO49_05080 [Planctomycetales bacterium 71-10]|nr:MAG: hypothetical protein BGO49_05080 [Planctomycetales bacterium 71-10]
MPVAPDPRPKPSPKAASMHVINLKAAWEASDADSDAPPIRVALPLDWAAIPWPDGRPPARARLARRFGRPPRSESPAPPRILLRGLAGVIAMGLNGAPVAWREEDGWHVVEPGGLLPRNILAIEVDPTRAAQAPGAWGDPAFLECGRLRAGPLGLPGGRG